MGPLNQDFFKNKIRESIWEEPGITRSRLDEKVKIDGDSLSMSL